VSHPRVVSLVPAATEIVWALGAGSWLVGVSHECDYPAEARRLPAVTRSTIDAGAPSGAIDAAVAAARANGVPPIIVDAELLRRLAPEIILTQSLCDVCAVGTSDLDLALRDVTPRPQIVTLHAHTLDEVWADVRRVGAALDLASEADELVLGLQSRLRRVAGPARRPRVLVLEWLDPPYIAGHWVPELVAAAGGADIGAAPGTHSRARRWSELRALDPELVVVAPCGFDVPRAQSELLAVRDPDALELFAGPCRTGFVDGNAYTSRPGPRLVDGAARIAELIRR
jgi:iron complex transport system substrate-binding protein